MLLPTSRKVFFGCTFVSLILISFALYLQHIVNIEPCPLCISQRIAIISIGFISLLAAIHNPQQKRYRYYGILLTMLSLTGLYLAGRQIWLQHLPADQVPSCAPALSYLVDILPFQKIVTLMLTGSGECAEIKWSFLNLNIPQWAALVFIGFTTLGCFEIFKRKN